MKERIVEIVIRLVYQLKTNNKNTKNKFDLKCLYKQGFTENEILTAYSWMTDKLNDENSEFKKLQSSANNKYRYISLDETELFTKEAINVITRLQALNLISNEHIDLMIEKALFLGFKKINEDMVKQYIAIFLFDAPDSNYTGSRTLLMSHDKVN